LPFLRVSLRLNSEWLSLIEEKGVDGETINGVVFSLGGEVMKRLASYKVLIAFSLIVLIIIGGVFLFQQQPWAEMPLEITLTTPSSASTAGMEVYVYGAVENPGWYPLKEDDRISDVLSMAGGVTGDSDPARVKLHIYEEFESEESVSPQLISVNRAGGWLLEALPGIGPVLAQNIIQYRDENGPFVMTEELMLVSGIGGATYDGLKDMVTVE
jgi:competence protein ComEA